MKKTTFLLLLFLNVNSAFSIREEDCNDYINNPKTKVVSFDDYIFCLNKETEKTRTQIEESKRLREEKRLDDEIKRKEAERLFEEYKKTDEYKRAEREKEKRNREKLKIYQDCSNKASNARTEVAAQGIISSCLELNGYYN